MNPDFEPISVDLAREADFSVGRLTIRPSLRQVEAGADSETLEPRVMQVLVALFQRRNEVVSRDELIARCWSGRVVGEDAISRCIARVRKLGDAHGAFGLETIARVGYRLTPVGDVAAVAPQATLAATAPAPTGTAGFQKAWSKHGMWIALAVVALAVATVFLVRGPASGSPDVDAVVARLTEKVGQTASKRDIDQIGAATKELGASTRPEERSAFAALASGNALQAIEGLEALAQEIETSGDAKSAAAVYTRIGALALVIDQGRGLAARRKAILLAPDSLNAFQGLVLDTALLRGAPEALQLAKDTLARPGLSDRMRGWVLAHRGLAEGDMLQQDAAAQATLDEMRELHRRTGNDIVEYSIEWLNSVLTLNRDDLRQTPVLAQRAMDVRSRLTGTERVSSMTEVTAVRAMAASGDWSKAFSEGVANLDERGRSGDFLPTPMIESVCTSGIFSGQAAAAEPYCRSLARRLDSSGGVMPKAYAGLLAAGLGDDRTASAEFAAAEAMLAAGSRGQTEIWLFEAYAALKRKDTDEAEQLVKQVVEASSASGLRSYRSYNANALRVLGEGFIANGQPARACAPLAEAGRLYAEVGGDAGRAAVDVLRGAASCR
ncbi:MAG: winged helix-turn-helix domain-containing protein [Hyphomonadaceae bacterium]|nr:winged helix-turn-helix domain-containing protein [Hyphomonadaceae bacterium]